MTNKAILKLMWEEIDEHFQQWFERKGYPDWELQQKYLQRKINQYFSGILWENVWNESERLSEDHEDWDTQGYPVLQKLVLENGQLKEQVLHKLINEKIAHLQKEVEELSKNT